MKKITFLFALLCASVMGWADTEYCGYEITGTTHGHKMSVTYQSLGSNQYTLIMTSTDDIVSYNAGSNFYTEVNGVGGTNVSANLTQSGNTLTFTTTSNPKPNVYVGDFYVNYSDGEEHYNIPTDEDWTATCGGGGSTPAPGEKFVAADASINSVYIAPGWTEDVASEATVNYNSSTGDITASILNALGGQWQGQIKLNLGFAYNASKYYDFSIKFHASKAIGGVTLKSNNDNALFYENQSVNLPADADYIWTKSDVAGVAGDNIFVFDFGWAAAGTDITISEISIIEKDEPSTPAVVETYCRKATGHLGNAEFGDLNGRILLTLRKLSDSSVRVKVEPNNNGVDYFDFVKVELNGVPQELGTVGGAALTDIEFDYTGLASLDFSVNVLWHNHNWADVNGRWTTNAIAVAEAELCEETIELSVGSEYCSYYGDQTRSGSIYATLTWETNEDGDVVITIGDGPGETNTKFRGNGLGDNLNGFTVLSGAGFATSEPASDYFNRVYGGAGSMTYTLQKKGGVTLPSPAKIHFQGKPFEWKCDQNNNAYTENKVFEYTYGKICSQLDAPTNVAIDANNILTFEAVAGADSYMAYVSLGGVEKYSQAVVSGDELTYTALVTGDYIINVVASGAGKVDSDPSADVVWHLEAAPVVLGNSEYCEHNMSSGNTEAAFTWETDADGNIVITISEVLSGSNDPAHFRANAFKDGIKVGASNESLSTYFNIPATIAGADHSQNSLTYTLIDPANAPALGEKIYYHGVVEYRTSENTDAWPTLDFEWTYGTVCSGKAVSASVNNNTMGSAVVKVGDDEVTSVDEGTEVSFIATSADPALYRFVNWTKGGVEVSTSATYAMTITETTNLVANFDYVRDTYCHYELLSNESAVQGKKLYMTVGAIGGGDYRIMFEGSAEAPFTGLQDANFVINQVTAKTDVDGQPKTGQDVPFTKANGRWNFSADGYGKAWIEFSLAEGKTIDDIYVWANAIYLNTASGVLGYVDNNDRLGLFGMNAAHRHNIDWEATCIDPEAPVFDKAEAEVLNESSVRLKIQATDNWGGLLTYTIARESAEPIISNHASGEEFTQDVDGLTAGTEYTFTVTVSDGVNNANQNIVVTPIADNVKPVMGEASLDSKTWNSAIINVAATDDKGVVAYHIVELSADFAPAEDKITVEGLTAATAYTFTIKAKDAAGNISDNSAEVSFTTDAHALVPTEAAPVPEWPADQVKSLYSNSYDFAPASLNSYNGDWWDNPNMNEGEIDDDNYLHYDLYRNGMIGWQYGEISVASLEKLHIDIFASKAGSVTIRPITNGDPDEVNNVRKTLNLAANQWNSFDIALTEFPGHDWTKLFQFAIENYQAGGLVGEHISVDNVYFYRTSALVDNEKPTNVSANVTKASFGSITLNVSGEDNSGNVIYNIKIGDTEYANGAAASGASKVFTINGLTPGTDYSISVNASDESGNEADPVIVVAQTVAITPAPVPTHNAASVRSVYSDAYESALAHDFLKNTWTGIPYSELNISGDHLLAYTNPNTPAQMPDIAWGVNNDGADAIIAKDGFNDGTNKGLDVRSMQHIHFDIWSNTATIYPELRLNDTQAGSIVLDGSGWQSFDLDISSLTDEQKTNIRWIKFIAFRDPAPEDIVIDNVYFWKDPDLVRDDDWMAPGELGTICIPNGAVAEGGDIYQLVGKNSEGKIVFSTVDNNQMEPGKPYLFEAKSNAMKFYFTSAEVGEPDNSGAMKGTFVDLRLPDDDPDMADLSDIYYFAGRALWSCVDLSESGLHVSANRAWVKMDEVEDITTPSSAPGRRYIIMGVNGENQTQGFENLESGDAPKKVMIEGTLYILLGEKVYDATGRLVK